MRIEAKILDLLRRHQAGMTLDEIESGLAHRGVRLPPGAVESMLLLSDKFLERTERWLRKTESKFDIIADAIKRHAEESGRRIFRAETALQGVPDALKPTRDELAQILLTLGDFELLKNDMIKRKD